jgi:hypothetical protein
LAFLEKSSILWYKKVKASSSLSLQEATMLWFLRVGCWLLFSVRFYYWFSKKYQRQQLKKLKNPPTLPEFNNLFELEDVLGRMIWREDGAEQWFDTIEHPKAIWAKFVANPGVGVEDCDGFAAFAMDRINNMIERSVPTGEVKLVKAYLLTVMYRDPKKGNKVSGHNVCLVQYVDKKGDLKYGHVGNWFSGKMQFGFWQLWDVVQSIAGSRELIQWAMANGDLELVDHGWNNPKR